MVQTRADPLFCGASLSLALTKLPCMRHIIAILLQNEAGALTRVAGLFSTRGYNIESLSVAPTDDPTVSRLTLVTRGSDAGHPADRQPAQQARGRGERARHDARGAPGARARAAEAPGRPGQADAVRGQVVRSGGRVLDPAMDGFIVELTASEAEVSGFVEDLATGRSCWRWCAAGRSASAAAPGRCGRARRPPAPEGPSALVQGFPIKNGSPGSAWAEL